MKFCDERLQKHLLNGGKIKKSDKGIWKFRPIVINKDNILVFEDTKEHYILSKQDLTTGDWEIIEYEYNWNKIIKNKILCVFSDDKDFKTFSISTLINVNYKNNTYRTNYNMIYNYCKPFNYEEFNVAEDLKEYKNENRIY